jgi:Cd2+/Zn2+-exporting ATPase
MPADGVLINQAASFDESALTGESLPVEHIEGGKIMAGAVVVDKVVQIQVTSRQGENAIDRILHLIEEAESRKAPLERFLDKFSRWYTPLMMLVSLLVIITPPLLFAQPWETWVYRGLALLLIACPCALVISTPAAITSGLAAAAKRGALIKGGAALELLGRVESVAFDKTGTLTQGKPQVTDVVAISVTDEQLLSLTASIEIGSSHPLAISLVNKAQDQGVMIPEATDKTAQVGSGVTGLVDGKVVQVIAPSKAEFKLNKEVEDRVLELEGQGKTVVVARHDSQVIGLIAWQDTLRQDAQQAVAALKQLGISSVMLTGDNPRSAEAIANQIGLDYKASLLPADKVHYVEEISAQHTVAMVGDGINDAPAMKASSIGIAMGGGTDVALETADAALTHNRLVELPAMIELSRATLNNIRQNVALALGLKGVFLVTSLLGITGLWVAVLADSGATALVTLNALRLLRFESKQVE